MHIAWGTEKHILHWSDININQEILQEEQGMFVITISRRRIVKIVAVTVCVAVAGAVAAGVKGFFAQDSTTAIMSKSTKISTTQEMIDYIASKGFTADIQTAQVTEVEIPKKFDDNFKIFDEKIKQTDGLSLEKHKGDKVNKWTFDLIDYGNEKGAAAVLLIKKEKLVGAYILEKPDGVAKAMIKTETPQATL